MKDITAKPDTLRSATAEVFVRMPPSAVTLIAEGGVSKGDPLEAAKLTAMMGAKRTWELLPYCHPIPLTGIDVDSALEADGVRIRVTVRCVAATGVEMEALTAASLAALNLYDMLKPHETDLEITSVRLAEKRGGKSDWREPLVPPVRAAVLVLSDTVFAGRKEDRAGVAVRDRLAREEGAVVEAYEVLPDEPERLQARLRALGAEGMDLVITVGGTGLTARDRTVEAVTPLLDRPIPGVMEAARAHGQRRTPWSMLSRGVAGMMGETMVVTFPGSTKGAEESYVALFPGLLHAFRMLRHQPHAHGHA